MLTKRCRRSTLTASSAGRDGARPPGVQRRCSYQGVRQTGMPPAYRLRGRDRSLPKKPPSSSMTTNATVRNTMRGAAAGPETHAPTPTDLLRGLEDTENFSGVQAGISWAGDVDVRICPLSEEMVKAHRAAAVGARSGSASRQLWGAAFDYDEAVVRLRSPAAPPSRKWRHVTSESIITRSTTPELSAAFLALYGGGRGA